jgi:hypothetical protein
VIEGRGVLTIIWSEYAPLEYVAAMVAAQRSPYQGNWPCWDALPMDSVKTLPM